MRVRETRWGWKATTQPAGRRDQRRGPPRGHRGSRWGGGRSCRRPAPPPPRPWAPSGAGCPVNEASPRGQVVEREAQPQADGQRREGVEQVVATGDPQGQRAELGVPGRAPCRWWCRRQRATSTARRSASARLPHADHRAGRGPRGVRRQLGRTRVVDAADQEAARVDPVEEARRTPRGRPPRCRSGRGGRPRRWSRPRRTAGRRGTPRRSRRPRPRTGRRAVVRRSCPVWARSPPTAYVGSAPAACSATVSREVVVVLPWVPATATTRCPCMTEARPADRGSSRRPRRRASTTSGLSSRTAVETTSVSAAATWSAS